MKRIIFILVSMFAFTFANAGVSDTITTKSGLKYVQTKAGNGKKPAKGDKVKVHYKGMLQDGTIFDESTGQAPFKFNVGEREVIPGWDEGFLMLSEGETGTLIIPAKLGYGAKGVKNQDDPKRYDIPPNSTLIFEVQLVKVR